MADNEIVPISEQAPPTEVIDSGAIPGKGTKLYDSIKEINDKFPKPEGEPPVRPTYE